MPTVRKNESRSKYISRCIPVVMRESGTKSRAHAVAKCHGMWKQAQKQEQISNKELSNDATGVENLSGGASETTPRDTRSNVPTVKSISRNGARRRVEAGDSSRSRGKTLNQRKRRRVVRFNPLRVDPTRTTTLRRIFQQALSARFRLLKGKLLRLIVDEDAFGLRKYNQVQSLNQEERSDEQQSNTGNSESNAASREGSEAASKPSSSPGNEVGRLGGGEGKATVSREDYVFINQNKEQGDDTGRQSERVDKGRVIDGQQWRGDGEASGKTGREIQLGVENTRGVEGADNRDLVTNQRWAFHTNPEKVKQFQVWLQTQIQADILTVTAEQAENAYWTKYVKEGYRKGAGRAFDDVNVAKRAESYGGSERLTGFYEGTREQFLQSSFGRPVAVEKVKLLTGRVFTELKGVTEAMATTITRELADGLVRGDNPRTIARRMIEQGIGTKTRGVQSRALTIARTETIRAHAEGQLDALEQMGVDKIGVMVEWSAAGDDRTCPKCLDLDGIVMKLKEARGIIPRHPNCRCSYIPANVGEATKGQIRGKADIQEAIDKSISRDLPKRTKRTLAEQKRRSRWAGADLKPSKVRPRDIAAEAGPVVRKVKPSVITPKKPRVVKPKPVSLEKRLKSQELEEVRQQVVTTGDHGNIELGKLVKERSDAFDELNKLNRQYTDILEKANLDDAVQSAIQEELLSVDKLADPIADRISALDKAIERRVWQNNRDLENVLAVSIKDRVKYAPVRAEKSMALADFNGVPTATKIVTTVDDKLKSAQQFLEQRTSKRSRASAVKPKVHRYPDTQRAMHSDGKGVKPGDVFVNDKSNIATYVHEIGHELEDKIPGARAKAVEFRDMRTARAGTKDVKLVEVFPKGKYRVDEVGNPDGWEKAFGKNAHYVGKQYKHGSTEIISMGVQKLYEDVVNFASLDPEYFNFIVGILRGSL